MENFLFYYMLSYEKGHIAAWKLAGIEMNVFEILKLILHIILTYYDLY